MGVDVLDLTDLQRRGLLKRTPVESRSEEVIDFTRASGASHAVTPVPPSATSDSNSAFDFLSSFAQSSVASSSSPLSDTTLASQGNSSEVSAKLDTIINKLEDTMYKIELLSGRVAQIEARSNR